MDCSLPGSSVHGIFPIVAVPIYIPTSGVSLFFTFSPALVIFDFLFIVIVTGVSWYLTIFFLQYLFSFYLCIWLCQVLVATWRIFSCGLWTPSMWDLVPWPGIEPGPPALGAQSISHWTTRAVPTWVFKNTQTPSTGGTTTIALVFKPVRMRVGFSFGLNSLCTPCSSPGSGWIAPERKKGIVWALLEMWEETSVSNNRAREESGSAPQVSRVLLFFNF